MTQTESKTFLKKNKQEISAPKTKSPIEKISPVKSSVQKAESTLPVIKEQTMPPETVMFNSPAEIVEKETSVELDESQNYLSNIQFNFKGDFKLEKFQSKNKFDNGNIISGNVISISDDFVGVDVGYKSIALIPKEQFADREGNLSTEMGKEEEIYVERLEDSEGQIKASKKKFEIVHIWKQVQEAYKKETTIEGTILEKIKGGMRVDVGVNAFLPDSQVDLKPILNLEEVMGKTFDFKVLKYNKKRANIVISRRALLEMDRLEKRAENLKKIAKKGNIVKGIVKNITDYGEGADFIIGETFYYAGEAYCALESIQASGLPAVLTVAPMGENIMRDNVEIVECLQELEQKGANIVGMNCFRGPTTMMPYLREARKKIKCHMAALPIPYRTSEENPTFFNLPDYPNCNCPSPHGRTFPTALDPLFMNRYEVRSFAEEAYKIGIKYLGVCCGANPMLIREVAEAMGKKPAACRFRENMKQHFIYGTNKRIKTHISGYGNKA